MRPGFGPAAELPTVSPARWRHGGCRSPLGSSNVIGGNRRAAPASARGTGRTAYTKDVRPTNHGFRGGTLSMKLRVLARLTQPLTWRSSPAAELLPRALPRSKYLDEECARRRHVLLAPPVRSHSLVMSSRTIVRMKLLRGLAQHALAAAKVTVFGTAGPLPLFDIRLSRSAGESVRWTDLVTQATRAVVIGAPGAGKTTLLKSLAARFAERHLAGEGPAPLLLDAAELEGPDLLPDLAKVGTRRLGRRVQAAAISDALHAGTIVLLIDAVDEASFGRRHQTLLQLNDLSRQYTAASVVLASRPAALDIAFATFEYYHIEPLELSGISAAAAALFAGRPDVAQQFLGALQANVSLQRLATSPILLGLLCNIFEVRGVLPTNTADVYADAADYLLADWDRAKSIRRPTLALTEKHPVLAELALEMVVHDVIAVSRAELERITAAALRKLSLVAETRRLVEELLSSGLLVEARRDHVEFVHKSFLEFYCARAIAANAERVIPFIGDRNHHELVVMACGLLQEVAPILESAIARREVTLAARCISHGRTRNIKLVDYVVASLLSEVGDGFASHLRRHLVEPMSTLAASDHEQQQLIRLWDAARAPGLPSHTRGARFEDFATAFFGRLFRVVHRDLNTQNGEIDLVCEITRHEPFWADFGGELMVECKNWATDVPLESAGIFAEKVSLARGVRLAFIVSGSGFTDHALTMLFNHAADPNKPLIVPIAGAELKTILLEGGDHEIFIKEAIRQMKYRRLY